MHEFKTPGDVNRFKATGTRNDISSNMGWRTRFKDRCELPKSSVNLRSKIQNPMKNLLIQRAPDIFCRDGK